MAQQLATLRTPAAYAGVAKFAKVHAGDAAAAAYLALGHAYLLDKRYSDAEASLREARKAGGELSDYADFLGAEANHEAGNNQAAELLLRGFTDRYPDSIFDAGAPELEANVLLELGNASGAERVLAAAPGSAGRTGYQLAQGMTAQAMGKNEEAVQYFKKLLLGMHTITSAIIRMHSSNTGRWRRSQSWIRLRAMALRWRKRHATGSLSG